MDFVGALQRNARDLDAFAKIHRQGTGFSFTEPHFFAVKSAGRGWRKTGRANADGIGVHAAPNFHHFVGHVRSFLSPSSHNFCLPLSLSIFVSLLPSSLSLLLFLTVS